MPVPKIPTYALKANASGRLISRRAGEGRVHRERDVCTQKADSEATEKRLQKHLRCSLSMFPRTVMSTSVTPKAIPNSVPADVVASKQVAANA